MKTRAFLVLLTLLSSLSVVEARQQIVEIDESDTFSAGAQINSCDGCVGQMAVTAQYSFVFDGDYNHLYDELNAIGIKVTAYDSDWVDSESGETTFKLASSRRALERWRRSNLGHRRVGKVSESANAIYAVAVPGQTVTIEFNQDPTNISAADFTINVRRYRNETLIGTRSIAVTPLN